MLFFNEDWSVAFVCYQHITWGSEIWSHSKLQLDYFCIMFGPNSPKQKVGEKRVSALKLTRKPLDNWLKNIEMRRIYLSRYADPTRRALSINRWAYVNVHSSSAVLLVLSDMVTVTCTTACSAPAMFCWSTCHIHLCCAGIFPCFDMVTALSIAAMLCFRILFSQIWFTNMCFVILMGRWILYNCHILSKLL